MQINHPTSVSAGPVSNQGIRADSASTPTAAPHSAASSSAASLSLLAYSLVPSFELLSLNAALSEIPPVRQDVLAQTILRLASGDLQGSSALEQTAAAIVGS